MSDWNLFVWEPGLGIFSETGVWLTMNWQQLGKVWPDGAVVTAEDLKYQSLQVQFPAFPMSGQVLHTRASVQAIN